MGFGRLRDEGGRRFMEGMTESATARALTQRSQREQSFATGGVAREACPAV
jgi:hypothetical protein